MYTFVQTALCGCTIGQVLAVLILFGLWPLHHVMHREIFKDNCLEGLDQDAGLLMMEVFPLVTNLLMSTARELSATFAAMALIPPFCEPLLLFLEPAMRLAEETGIVHHIAG